MVGKKFSKRRIRISGATVGLMAADGLNMHKSTNLIKFFGVLLRKLTHLDEWWLFRRSR